MRSWFDPEREVAEPWYFSEWDPEMWDLLQLGEWIEKDGYMYRLTRTKRTVVRFKINALMVGTPPIERTHRKNYHLLGMKLAKAETHLKLKEANLK